MRLHRALLLVATAVLASCAASESTPLAEAPAPVALRSAGQGFVLETTVPRLAWRTDEAIQLDTTLTYTGPRPKASLWGSGSGVVEFQVQELTGNRSMGAPMTADCHQWDFVRGQPSVIRFGKGAAWTADDPNAEFYRAWSGDPLLHLPPGQWRIAIHASAFLQPCDQAAPELDLALPPIVLDVR